MPKRESPGSAGYDVCSLEDVTVPARGSVTVSTGISLAFPSNVYCRVASRSGLAAKKNIEVGAGVIDSDYRGIVHVILRNHSDTAINIKGGSAIAQLIFTRIECPELRVVKFEDLGETKRGGGGFGSTGLAR